MIRANKETASIVSCYIEKNQFRWFSFSFSSGNWERGLSSRQHIGLMLNFQTADYCIKVIDRFWLFVLYSKLDFFIRFFSPVQELKDKRKRSQGNNVWDMFWIMKFVSVVIDTNFPWCIGREKMKCMNFNKFVYRPFILAYFIWLPLEYS